MHDMQRQPLISLIRFVPDAVELEYIAVLSRFSPPIVLAPSVR
jgi:hypothetical protein